jgi:hypothetical protein
MQKWSDHFGINNDGVKQIARKLSKCAAGESDTLSTASALLDAGRTQLPLLTATPQTNSTRVGVFTPDRQVAA